MSEIDRSDNGVVTVRREEELRGLDEHHHGESWNLSLRVWVGDSTDLTVFSLTYFCLVDTFVF